MKVAPSRKTSLTASTLNAILLALVLLSAGCASAHREHLGTASAAVSTPSIRVSQPAIYRDAKGIVLAGYLETRGPGAHSLPPGHLHAELLNTNGEVITETTTAAPAIRHNRFRTRETTHYAIRLADYPAAVDSIRVTLHRVRSSDCSKTTPSASAQAPSAWLTAQAAH
ncbi:MAG: hypothetical protein RI897_684 [Verrucomicrobiota bacterium]|jgi:hypothetical protein